MSTHSVLSKSLRALRTLDPEIYLTVNDATYGVSLAIHNYMIDINSPSDGAMYLLDPAQVGDVLSILGAGHRNLSGRVRAIKESRLDTNVPPLGYPTITLSGESLDELMVALQHRFVADSSRANIDCVRIECGLHDDDEMLRVVSTNGHGMFVHGVNVDRVAPTETVIHNKVVGLITDLVSERGTLALEMLIDENKEMLLSLMSGEGDVITIRSHDMRNPTRTFPTWRQVLSTRDETAVTLDDFGPLLVGVYQQRKHTKKLDDVFLTRVDGVPALLLSSAENELRHVFAHMGAAPSVSAALQAVDHIGDDASPHIEVITRISCKYALTVAEALNAAQLPATLWAGDRRRPLVFDVPSAPELHALVMPVRGDALHVVQGLYAMTVCG